MNTFAKALIFTFLFPAVFNLSLEAKDSAKVANTFEEAQQLAEENDMPIAVTWSADSGESMSSENSTYGKKFVWVHLDAQYDAAILKKLGKDAYFKHGKMRSNEDGKNHKTSGYIFMNAKGDIYSRLPNTSDRGIKGMLVGVCRRHYGYEGFYGTTTFNGRPAPKDMPGKLEILPAPSDLHVWKDCDKCSKFIHKAMPYIASEYPNNWYGGMLGSWTCVPAMMMYGKHDRLLKKHFEVRAEHYYSKASTTFGGYMNWFLAGNGLSMSEYALRYGLTPKIQELLEKTHQDAAEYVDDSLSWFHHPRKGGSNYSREIGMIGCFYQAVFSEMDYMGLTAEPGLSLARAACSRGAYGSVGGPGKNGIVVSGMYPAGRADDPFTQQWQKWQWGGKEPTGGGIFPQQQHAYANWHWMGAAVGMHRMGPGHYNEWATKWIHTLIELQLPDGSIPKLENDTSEGTKDPMDYVRHVNAKSNKKGNWEGTGVLASMILMTEPGAFYGVPMKPKGSMPNREAFDEGERLFKEKRYAEAYSYFAVVLPRGVGASKARPSGLDRFKPTTEKSSPGDSVELVPSARVKLRICEEKIVPNEMERRKHALTLAKLPAEKRAEAGIALYRKLSISTKATVHPYRTWTSTQGSIIEARLVHIFGGRATLKRRDGSILKVKPSQLSTDDRQYLKGK